MRLVGQIHQFGAGVPKDLAKAQDWLKQAALAGDSNYAFDYAYFLAEEIKTESAFLEALDWYKKLAATGNGSAAGNIGLMYDRGEGVEKNEKVAFEWYLKAADYGHAQSSAIVGERYASGVGTEQNAAKAFVYFERACDGNYGIGCNSAGIAYHSASGTDEDLAKALERYQKGCDLKNADACWNVGALFYEGAGVDKDLTEALRYTVNSLQLSPTTDRANAVNQLRDDVVVESGTSDLTWQAVEVACEAQSAWACNTLAWTYATAADANKRNAEKAVTLAEKAYSLDNDDAIRDTLAAAYAEAGRFADAVREQQAIVDGGATDPQFSDRLELYKQGKPFRES